MSLKMTFRQKLIRISSSAAICGLSCSFVLAETVDSQARALRSWVVDPALIPEHYLPLHPLEVALQQSESNSWRDNLIAINSQQPVANQEPVATIVKAPIVTPTPTQATSHPDQVKTFSGAAVKRPVQKSLAADIGKDKATRLPWLLQGRILNAKSIHTEAGHFEIGLFAKIDPDGNPVGFPFPQQILPMGQFNFRLEIPARVERGYLFGEFVAARGGRRTLMIPPVNPWERSNNQLAELIFRPEDTIPSVASSAAREALPERWKVRGVVTTMFAPGQAILTQEDVIVKVRGRKEATRTDHHGNFVLELPRMKGTLFLEVLKAGYHPSVVSVVPDETHPIQIEIASRHAIEQISQRLGASQSLTRGIFLGRAIDAEGIPLRSVTAQLSLKADGPFYFDEEGGISRNAKATSATGRFIFLNVDAGAGYLETTINGEAIAPIQVSVVDGGELIQRTLTPTSGTVRGRIFNPVAAGGKMLPIGGARVRVDGASEWETSDSYGAFSIGPMKWMKGEPISLEVTAEKLSNHHYLVNSDQSAAPLSLFVFPAAYIARLAQSMDVDVDPYSGVVIGKVSGPSVRIDALADHSLVNNARDFYFDSKGRLRGSHEMTDPRFGTYIIFNVPKGRALLQGNDSAGVLRYSDSVFASPSSINVQME